MSAPVYSDRRLPEIAGTVANPSGGRRAYTGFDVEPFFVHQGLSDDGTTSLADDVDDCELWHLTHIRTGLALQKCIPNAARGIWLAQKLALMGCWDFSTRAAAVNAVTDEQKAQIAPLLFEAVNGECQGDLS